MVKFLNFPQNIAAFVLFEVKRKYVPSAAEVL